MHACKRPVFGLFPLEESRPQAGFFFAGGVFCPSISDTNSRYQCSRRTAGFSLVELTVVVFLISLVLSVALPQLIPVIAFSELQGMARHMANYGRGAVAEATMLRETLIVRFDLDAQEYYTVRISYPQSAEGEEYVDQWALLEDSQSFASDDFKSSLSLRSGGDLFGAPEGFDDLEANGQLRERFDRFARTRVMEAARNVRHEEGLMDDIGPLFDEEFSLDMAEPEEVELTDMVLERVKLPETVRLESVVVAGVEYASGVAEIELSPLGLLDVSGMYLVNEDDEYYTVIWDPVTGQTQYIEGRQSLETA